MEGSPWRILLGAILLIQLTYADQHYELSPDGELMFNTPLPSVDWPLLEQDTNIAYTENSGTNHIFAYSVYDPSKKTAVIKIVTTKDKTEETGFPEERCEYDFDVPDNSTVVFEDLSLRTGESTFVLSFFWHVEGENEKHYGNVNTVNCHRAEQRRKLGKQRKKRELPTEGEEAAIGDRIPDIKRDSVALDRYGVCWTGDKSVTCAQGPMTAKTNSSQLTNWATVKLDWQPAFLGVHNYAENKMLVAVGNCERSDCDYFYLFEVRPEGKVFKHTYAPVAMSECRSQRDITVSGYYDDVRKQTCFDAVCVAKSSLKYRRACTILKK